MRYFLPAYLCAYVFVAFLWRSYRVWKKTGVNPVAFKGADNAHDFIGRVFELVLMLVLLVVLLYSIAPTAYTYTVPIGWLQLKWLQWTGVALLLASLAWTAIAQAQMGVSWRIGIDSERRTPLVQKGVFRISRNPIFLGIVMTLVGLFLTIPNAVTLLVMVLGAVLVGVQVRLEEEYLMRVHPEEYEQYRRRVRRWL